MDGCSNLIEEAEGYIIDPDATGDRAEQPVKINDHAMDTLRYVVMGVDRNRNLSPPVPQAKAEKRLTCDPKSGIDLQEAFERNDLWTSFGA